MGREQLLIDGRNERPFLYQQLLEDYLRSFELETVENLGLVPGIILPATRFGELRTQALMRQRNLVTPRRAGEDWAELYGTDENPFL